MSYTLTVFLSGLGGCVLYAIAEKLFGYRWAFTVSASLMLLIATIYVVVTTLNRLNGGAA
jgi:hypothetical protein